MNILSRFNSEGNAYLTLQIPLGVQSLTRAEDDFEFNDGDVDGKEYKVKDAYIIFFAGTDETSAKFASAYCVTPSPVDNDNVQITTTATITLSDANLNKGDKLFPFVVLNNNNSAITSQSLTRVIFANDGSPVELAGGSSTFSDLGNVVIANYRDNNGYFLMTNATLAKANTAGASLLHLPQIEASYFYPSEEQSRQNPAGHVNVERLAVKAVVSGLGTGTHTILGNEYATFEDGDMMFALDNYNTKSYAYRHLSAVSYSRFVENTAVEPYYPLVYRTYWGEDANYSGKAGLVYKDHANRAQISWKAMSASDYCAENTFDVGHMQDDCTTSVLVRLQLNKGEDPDHRGDFYTTSVTGQDIIFQPPSNTLEEEGTSASSSFSRTRSNVVTYDGTNIATIDDYLRTWLMQQSSALRSWVRDYAGNEPKHLKIEVSGNAETGLATATLSQTAQTSGTGYNKFESQTDAYEETGGVTLKAYLQALLNSLTIKFYDDGYCYYRVLIRHFDDTQTPWNSVSTMTNNTTAQVYGGNAASYLGRYGVVRNNWYNIRINSVTHVGSPIIPELTSDADDKVEQLLNATLQISGWEGHNQNL